MRIVVLDGYTLNPGDNPWTGLERLGTLEVHPRSTPEQVPARAREADVLVVNKVRLDAPLLEALPRLKFIAVTATGHDGVDLGAARARGILVANVPEYGTDSVAQWVIAALLYFCHRVDWHDQAVRAGQWTGQEDFCFWLSPQQELAGKTIGIIGFGRIGRRVGQLAHALGMYVLAHTPRPGQPPWEGNFAWCEREPLLRRSDVVSLHCPLTPETIGMVDRPFLDQLQPSAILMNSSRGGLVVEHELARALNERRLAGAALDVVSHEPIQPHNPLLLARNCLLTPHLAWATLAARQRLMAATADNVAAFLAGRPRNLVQTPET